MSFNKWYEIQGWPELHRDKMRSAWNAAKRAERRKTTRDRPTTPLSFGKGTRLCEQHHVVESVCGCNQ